MIERVNDFVEALKAQAIIWQRDLDDPHLLHATALGQEVSLRIGDFPDAPLFTVFTSEGTLSQFDDRPLKWQIPPR
jgi:hypothetical protein